MIVDRQTHTDRHVLHNTPLPYRGGVTTLAIDVKNVQITIEKTLKNVKKRDKK